MVVGVLAGLPDLFARISVEQGNRRVELVADQQTFVQLAAQAGVTPQALLNRLQAVGVQGLGVSEDTLASLDQQGQVTVLSGADWLRARRAVGLPAPQGPAVNPTGTYALVPTDDRALQEFIAAGLGAALGPGQAVTEQPAADVVAIGVDAPPDVAEGLPLGFGPHAFDLARLTGMDVVPRPAATARIQSTAATKGLFAQISAAGVPVHTILFAGAPSDGLPGYPDNLNLVADTLLAAGWNLGVTEAPQELGNIDQPGTRQLSEAMGQPSVRLYSVPPWLLQQYSPDEAVTSLVGSVEERNLRILYLHPLQAGPDAVSGTVALYGNVVRVLRAHGFQLGPPRPLPTVRVTAAQRVLQSLAVAATGLLLLDLLFPELRRYGYWPPAALCAAACVLALGSPRLSVEIVGVAASSFGGLAMCYAAHLWRRWHWPDRPSWGQVWARAAAALVVMSGITSAGALILATLMGDTPHLLGWEYFHGVKVTYLSIPLLALLAFGVAVGFEEGAPGGLWAQGTRLIGRPVRWKHVFVIGLASAVGAIYLVRSGNVRTASVPPLELHMRDALQQMLTYRPREKEFLVGYPSMFLAMYGAARRHRWAFLVFLLGASVSQVSVVDTFEHAHTPVLYSLSRELVGLAMGLATGAVALAAAWMPGRRRSHPLPQAQPTGAGVVVQ